MPFLLACYETPSTGADVDFSLLVHCTFLDAFPEALEPHITLATQMEASAQTHGGCPAEVA